VRDGLAETLLTVRERVSSGAIVLRIRLTPLLTDGRATDVGRAGLAARAGTERDGRKTRCALRTGDTLGTFGAVGRGIVTLLGLGARRTRGARTERLTEGRATETDGRDGARGAAGREGNETLPMLRTDLDEKDGADLGALLEMLDDFERNDGDERILGRLEIERLGLETRALEPPLLRDMLRVRPLRICATDSVAVAAITTAPTRPRITHFVDMTATTFRVQYSLITYR